MRVPAKLRDDPRIGMACEVGGHHRHRPAKEAERRNGHALVLDLDVARQAVALGGAQQLQRRVLAGGRRELRMGTARDLLAGEQPEGVTVGLGQRHKSRGYSVTGSR
jgi:hypothetical protein